MSDFPVILSHDYAIQRSSRVLSWHVLGKTNSLRKYNYIHKVRHTPSTERAAEFRVCTFLTVRNFGPFSAHFGVINKMQREYSQRKQDGMQYICCYSGGGVGYSGMCHIHRFSSRSRLDQLGCRARLSELSEYQVSNSLLLLGIDMHSSWIGTHKNNFHIFSLMY